MTKELTYSSGFLRTPLAAWAIIMRKPNRRTRPFLNYVGNEVPNMGRLLTDCSSVASS
jgi:hypothetical protein